MAKKRKLEGPTLAESKLAIVIIIIMTILLLLWGFAVYSFYDPNVSEKLHNNKGQTAEKTNYYAVTENKVNR